MDFRDLLPKLTLEEKITLLSGRDFTTVAGVERLGIPPIRVCTPAIYPRQRLREPPERRELMLPRSQTL